MDTSYSGECRSECRCDRHVYLPNTLPGATVTAWYRRGEGDYLRTVRAPIVGWRVDPADTWLQARPIVAGMPLDWAELYAVEHEGAFYFPDRTCKNATHAENTVIELVDERDAELARRDQDSQDAAAAMFARIRELVPAD